MELRSYPFERDAGQLGESRPFDRVGIQRDGAARARDCHLASLEAKKGGFVRVTLSGHLRKSFSRSKEASPYRLVQRYRHEAGIVQGKGLEDTSPCG
jgi:hypothetical protein